MAINQDDIIINNLKKMGKDKALEFMKTNQAKLKANPELSKKISSLMNTAFTGVQTGTNSLISTGNKTTVPPSTITPTPNPTPTSTYTGSSLVDYLSSSGKPTSYTDRANLAKQYGITNYTGTAAQNTQLLNALRSGQTTTPSTTTPSTTTPSTTTTPEASVKTDTWGVVGKVNDPTRVANFINTLPGYQVKVNADGTITGTKQGMPTTWKYDNENWVATPDNAGFDHSGLAGASFVPDKISSDGISFNSKGKNTQEKFGIIKAQEDYIAKMKKQWEKQGLSVVQQKVEATRLMKQIQDFNKNKDTYGKLPIEMEDTVGSMVDLNEDGIPDNQQGYGMDETTAPNPTETTMFTDPLTGNTYESSNNFNDLEKTVIKYTQDMLKVEADAKEAARLAAEKVTDENAKRIIEENNKYIADTNALLDERIKANEQQYTDAIGAVARQLGGQVRQFQKIMGADGKAIDDATMLSLMGGVGVDAMAKVVDLKNQLVTEYIGEKEKAIKKINELKMSNAMEANQADAAIAALNEKAKSDVITLTKEFYNKMFGMSEADQTRTATNLSNIRTAVTGYLSALGQTPAQINQLINNYVVKGFTPEDALRQVSDDIRNGTNAVLNNIVKNNADAARAAQAKFEADMALKIQPIVTKGDVDLQLQNDKQAFEESQNALDRELARSKAISGSTPSKAKKISQSTWERGYAQFADAGLTLNRDLTESQYSEILNAMTVHSQSDGNNAWAKQVLDDYGYSNVTPTVAQTASMIKAPTQ